MCFLHGVPIIILNERLGAKLNFDMIYIHTLDIHVILYQIHIYDQMVCKKSYNNGVNNVLECD